MLLNNNVLKNLKNTLKKRRGKCPCACTISVAGN
jgi:hypothetical protein